VRHRKNKVTLDRTARQRRPLFRNLLRSFVEHERITTTSAKAKAIRPRIERLITTAKGGTLADRRRVISALNDPALAHKLMTKIAPRFATRPGGYLRLVKLTKRAGDGADRVLIECVE